MKLLIALCFVGLVGLSLAKPKHSYPRGCVYVDGVCVRECDEGSHAHMTACGYRKPRKPPATCDNPNPETENSGRICNIKTGSACYCDPPTVRDTTIDKCVPLEECPKKDSTILF